MKNLYKYYVVDSLTESVVGSFFALNNDVAIKVLEETLKSNEKLKLVGEYLRLLYDEVSYTELETFSEVVEVCIDSKWIPVKVDSKNGLRR